MKGVGGMEENSEEWIILTCRYNLELKKKGKLVTQIKGEMIKLCIRFLNRAVYSNTVLLRWQG